MKENQPIRHGGRRRRRRKREGRRHVIDLCSRRKRRDRGNINKAERQSRTQTKFISDLKKRRKNNLSEKRYSIEQTRKVDRYKWL